MIWLHHSKSHCRHMDLDGKKRNVIPCYWEKQASGCTKPHCPFLHDQVEPPSQIVLILRFLCSNYYRRVRLCSRLGRSFIEFANLMNSQVSRNWMFLIKPCEWDVTPPVHAQPKEPHPEVLGPYLGDIDTRRAQARGIQVWPLLQ